MTTEEFGPFRERLTRDYAADHVNAGDWPEEGSHTRALEDFHQLLPEGLATSTMLLVIAETADQTLVGHLWLGLDRPAEHGGGAWIYFIGVDESQRGLGFGRRLLQAAEDTVVAHGGAALGLNVFGPNTVARNLYESAGYQTMTVQMRKVLDP
jgi:ribosomal protein S18 acetylase RimI-like enzyme